VSGTKHAARHFASHRPNTNYICHEDVNIPQETHIESHVHEDMSIPLTSSATCLVKQGKDAENTNLSCTSIAIDMCSVPSNMQTTLNIIQSTVFHQYLASIHKYVWCLHHMHSHPWMAILHHMIVVSVYLLLMVSSTVHPEDGSWLHIQQRNISWYVLYNKEYVVIFFASYAGWHACHSTSHGNTFHHHNAKSTKYTESKRLVLVFLAMLGTMFLYHFLQDMLASITAHNARTDTYQVQTSQKKQDQLVCIACFSAYFALHIFERNQIFVITFYIFISLALCVMIATIPHADVLVTVWSALALCAALYAIPNFSSSDFIEISENRHSENRHSENRHSENRY
jgi:hypothetical protein